MNTPKQVEEIVSWLRYPPDGIRGYAQTSHQTNYKSLPAEDFIAAIEKETLLLIQIERKVALGHLDEMLSIPGIDVAVRRNYGFVGGPRYTRSNKSSSDDRKY